jgi:hypothetical protein
VGHPARLELLRELAPDTDPEDDAAAGEDVE